MSELHLFESAHPNKVASASFDRLAGLDGHKSQLVHELTALLDRSRGQRWQQKHHPSGLALAEMLESSAPVVMLSGEVGCGKTAIATSVATPVAEALDARVLCFETPSNVRGTGLVGDLSNRLTTVFSMAKAKLKGSNRYGILIIDEADDLATSRAQLQAHHEDRAGLNVLVKQIDTLARDAPGLAVIIITNRLSVLDPAIRRRVALHLVFERPDAAARHRIFSGMLQGVEHRPSDVDELVRKSEREDVPFSSSDLIHRVGRLALSRARAQDAPLSVQMLMGALGEVEPTPLVEVAPLC